MHDLLRGVFGGVWYRMLFENPDISRQLKNFGQVSKSILPKSLNVGHAKSSSHETMLTLIKKTVLFHVINDAISNQFF